MASRVCYVHAVTFIVAKDICRAVPLLNCVEFIKGIYNFGN